MTLYSLVVAIHVVGVIGAFGVLFAWPWLPAAVPRPTGRGRGSWAWWSAAPRASPCWRGPTSPPSAACGARPGPVPLVIFVVVLGVVGSYLTPSERRLAEAAYAEGDAAPAAAAGPGGARLRRPWPWPRSSWSPSRSAERGVDADWADERRLPDAIDGYGPSCPSPGPGPPAPSGGTRRA